MADFDNPPSPQPPSSSSSPPLPAAGNQPTKRKDPPSPTATAAASSTGPSPSKRPNIPRPPPPPLPFLPLATAASSGDVQDTATSKLLDVQLDDLEILENMMKHHKERGKFPTIENPDEMRAFILPYTIKSIGTEEGWKEKMEQLKRKFNSGSQPVEEEEKKEFDLWRKIWGKDGGDDDHDPSGGAVGV